MKSKKEIENLLKKAEEEYRVVSGRILRKETLVGDVSRHAYLNIEIRTYKYILEK